MSVTSTVLNLTRERVESLTPQEYRSLLDNVLDKTPAKSRAKTIRRVWKRVDNLITKPWEEKLRQELADYESTLAETDTSSPPLTVNIHPIVLAKLRKMAETFNLSQETATYISLCAGLPTMTDNDPHKEHHASVVKNFLSMAERRLELLRETHAALQETRELVN